MAFCYRLFYLCIVGARAWFALPAVSQTCSQSALVSSEAVLCHRFCSTFSWTEFLGAAKWRRESGSVASRFRLCYLQMMWSCWPHRTVNSSSHWDGSQPSVKRQRQESEPLNLRPWFLAGKGWIALYRSGRVASPSGGV